jgi:hypothetical protein
MNESVLGGVAAFFPWITIDEPLNLGTRLRLLPYRVGKAPGDLAHATQKDLDGILEAYGNRPTVRVPAATILEVDDWLTGVEDIQIKTRLFQARIAIGFSALAHRQLFSGHIGYCGYDSYSLVIQRYRVGDTGMFAFDTRRRDGAVKHMWGADEFAFQRPLHVDTRARMEFDHELAQVLFELPAAGASELYEALREFNSANTDSADVPPHVEVVMMKSAFEWLLGISEKSKEFVHALDVLLPDSDREEVESGPLQERWRKRFSQAVRPLHAWAQEFCDLRGAAAHGTRRHGQRFVWSTAAHLAFASTLFPLLVKRRLALSGNWQLSSRDAQRLRRIDSFLMHDPFAHHNDESDESHPWTQLEMQALIAANAHEFFQSDR